MRIIPKHYLRWLLYKSDNIAYRSVINRLSLRIHSSSTMRKYIKKIFHPSSGKDIIFMEYFSENYFFKKRLPLLSSQDKEPHLIFLGSTDFFSDPVIDVRLQLLEITKRRIHVHLRKPALGLVNVPYIHIFEGFDSFSTFQGELSTFMTQFDACLVLYNIYPGVLPYRFHNTLPSRFLFALTSGIPIVMPKDIFTACEELISHYDIGFAYRTDDELSKYLYDECFMSKFRENAFNCSPKFTYENNWERLNYFLNNLSSGKDC
ncbi:MAG: hypothetical protein PHX21_06220 [bacterium]|nr:hypothetical protein [bacterium]